MDIMQKRTWAEIDLDAVAHNLEEIRGRIGGQTMVCCVIKADAYGHGAVRLAREYEALGADWLAVSNIEEALQLRRAGVSLPLLVLGYTPPAAAGQLAENNISQCAYSTAYCAALSENAVRCGVAVKIHIKVDTGMSRLGFYFQDVDRDAAAVAEIAAAYGLRESFLTAVLRRYPSLRTQQAPHRLEICGGPNCARQSSARLMAHIERTYGVRSGGISQTGGFSYRVIGCMKHCGKGPNLKWDGQIYNGVTPERVDRLIRGDG